MEGLVYLGSELLTYVFHHPRAQVMLLLTTHPMESPFLTGSWIRNKYCIIFSDNRRRQISISLSHQWSTGAGAFSDRPPDTRDVENQYLLPCLQATQSYKAPDGWLHKAKTLSSTCSLGVKNDFMAHNQSCEIFT